MTNVRRSCRAARGGQRSLKGLGFGAQQPPRIPDRLTAAAELAAPGLGSASLRTAILVSNTRIAYLARIAFGHAGEANYRVFYNDFAPALTWLE